MAQHCDFTLTGLRKNLETAWTKITSDTLKGIMKKVAHWEDYSNSRRATNPNNHRTILVVFS
jgi:hypothetical protein